MESWNGTTGTEIQHHVVVCVVDPDLLNLVRRYCAALPCRTFATESPEEALALLDSSRVSLVLADQRLKTTSGTLLLKEVAHRSPLTARVLLASYPENHDIIDGDEERLHGIIGKPWDGPSLQRTIMAILQWQEERSRMAQSPTDSGPTYNTPTRSIRNAFSRPPPRGSETQAFADGHRRPEDQPSPGRTNRKKRR